MVEKTSLSHVISRVVGRELPQHLWRTARSFIQSLELACFEHGNFTIVTLSDLEGEVWGAGASKRMPGDVADDAIGYNIALVRAVESVVKTIAADEVLTGRFEENDRKDSKKASLRMT